MNAAPSEPAATVAHDPPPGHTAGVVVDSNAWIAFFNGKANAACDALRRLLAEGDTRIVVPDLVLFEVLRGFRDEAAHCQAQRLMTSIDVESTA